MGVWTLEYRSSAADEFTVIEVVGAAGIPPFFDQISTDDFTRLEIYATHSDEPEATIYKAFDQLEWARAEAEA